MAFVFHLPIQEHPAQFCHLASVAGTLSTILLQDMENTMTDGHKRSENVRELVLASSKGIERYHRVIDDFVLRILGLDPRNCLITDESELSDFDSLFYGGTETIWGKIKREYGLCRSDVTSERLLDIFGEIERRELG